MNERGVSVATIFLPQLDISGGMVVTMPVGYRVGCDGDENETSSAYEDCVSSHAICGCW